MRKTLFFTIGIAIACGAIYLFDRFDASSAAEKPEKPKLRAMYGATRLVEAQNKG